MILSLSLTRSLALALTLALSPNPSFRPGSHYISMAVLELPMQSRLASNSERSSSLFLLGGEIKGICHHTQMLSSLEDFEVI